MSDLKKKVLGTWRFVISELRSEDGEVSYPDGMHPVGYLIYTEGGYFTVANMHGDRPKHTTDDLRSGKDEEIVASYNTFFCCGGKYDLLEEESSVIHHIEVCQFPNWAGIDQKRFLEFEGNRMHLSTPPLPIHNKMQTAHLIWEKVE